MNHQKKRKWGRGAGRGRGVEWARQGHLRGGGHMGETMYGNVKCWWMVLIAGGLAINHPKSENRVEGMASIQYEWG
jgi:hypothetical protein